MCPSSVKLRVDSAKEAPSVVLMLFYAFIVGVFSPALGWHHPAVSQTDHLAGSSDPMIINRAKDHRRS